jgi:LmbE family N-acetylglucosaminyl deacetylase
MKSALAPERPLVVVSPHLDDGVFSCGALLARYPGARVITALAGLPPGNVALTEWDRASGFASSAQAVAARRDEDRAGLAVLDAEPCWLDFPDNQYGGSPDAEQLAAALLAVIERAGAATVLLPLGLFHSDHLLTHAAGRLAVDRLRVRCGLYEDAIYRRYPGLRDEKLRTLASEGVRLSPCTVRADTARKRAAVACYRSQLGALGTPGRPGHHDVFADERYWWLTR